MSTNTNIKIHNYCFLAMECFIMLPLLIKNMTVINAGAFVVGIGYLAYLLLGKEEYAGKPAGLLATIVFVDMLLIGFLRISFLFIEKELMEQIFSGAAGVIGEGIIMMVLAGLILRFLGNKFKATADVIIWIGMEITMFLLIASKGSWGAEKVYVLIFYTAVSFFWFFSARVSKICAEGNAVKTLLKSWVLFVLFFVFSRLGYIPFSTYMAALPQNYLSFYEKYMSWLGLALTVIICLSIGFFLKPKSEKDNRTTALIFWGFAGILLMLKALQIFYFTYNWVLAVFYMILVAIYIGKEERSKSINKYFGMYIWILTAGMLVLFYAVNRGLWMICIAAVILWGLSKVLNIKEREVEKNLWIVLGIFVFVAAFFFHYRFSMINMIAFAAIMLFGILTILLIAWPHPAGIDLLGKYSRIAVTAAVLLLLFLLWGHSGAKIRVKQDFNARTASVTVKAVGKENEIKKSYYYWTDSKAKKVSEETSFLNQINSIGGQNECLTIVTIDKNNVKTMRKVWFPYDFFNVWQR